MDIQHPAATFNFLKPAYNLVIQQPSKNHILKLTELLRSVSPSALQVLQDVSLFPLQLQLQNMQLGLEIKRYLVDCMKEILQRTHVCDLKKFLELYTMLFFQIYDQKKSCLVGDVPEELKLSVVECVTSLLKQASSDVICELYDRKYAPKLGQGIYIAIQMAQWEKSRPLRLAAIECVMTLAQVHGDADRDDIVFRHQVGDVLMFFLPGIVSGLQRIATDDEKQGHQITMLAVKAWAETVAVVMEDSNSSDDLEHFNMQFRINPTTTVLQEDPLVTKWEDCSKESMLKSLQEKNRTPEWYHAAAEKLAVSAKAICRVQHHSHWKVRMALASSCHLLLSRCCRNLKPCVMYLIEMLIMLSEDEYEDVAAAATKGLRLYSEKCETHSGKSLLEILEDNFYNLVTKLPRILHGTDDVQQLSALRLLSGYIKLLGVSKLPHLLSSVSHLNRLMWTLIQAFELDNSCISLLEDYSLRDLEVSQVEVWTSPWKQFKYFTDHSILKKMEDVCCMLGQYGDLSIMSYRLLDIFHSNPYNRKEITFLLNEILCGGAYREDTNLEDIIREVLQVYLEPSIWYVSLSVGTHTNELQEEVSITLGQAQSNVIQACLLVEGVGKMARVLGSKFDQFLLKTLYLVLERAGSANGLVVAIRDISHACGYGRDVTDLVQANVDYFSYHVTFKLRRMEQNAGVMDVLNIVMKYSSMDVLPCLEDIVKDAGFDLIQTRFLYRYIPHTQYCIYPSTLCPNLILHFSWMPWFNEMKRFYTEDRCHCIYT
ncbi:TELO2-interacting protein 1 homolog isoform X2 [Zootermopsis nevadensis]|nr:TELO2-interacting protein 1 homolog isoform X2 [Zootermopsis nevadensis]XP_021917528.1 TELO2-interacting protein 1 homolog isoform X2 [Zootermopsis nevadensis]XP_021917529.1 TELO2-interacting protein 1 homolog isoform X2 [Zootermopsis nevadensis]XP_021917530.1 TELO2-interacting protein 1 homolog isoform X2 [Zootermopsis nevadensis]